MPTADHPTAKFLYDVRGAFVTAKPDVSQQLIATTDNLVDAAIRATVRSIMLPRTIISVRIDDTTETPFLIGFRRSATVTVQAVSVPSGDPIAEGTFTESVLLFDHKTADQHLAEKIASRISSEFRLDASHPLTLASAYAE